MAQPNQTSFVGEDAALALAVGVIEELRALGEELAHSDLLKQIGQIVFTKSLELYDSRFEDGLLAGTSEAADIVCVSKQRITQLASADPRMPPPIARLRATPVWLTSEITEYAHRRKLIDD